MLDLKPFLQTSYTQQKTLLRCPKKFEYHYIRGIRPQREDDRFLLGRAVHTFLEVYYGAQADGKAAQYAFPVAYAAFDKYIKDNFPKDDEAYQQAELADAIVKHYYNWAYRHDDFKVLGTEIPFQIKVANSVWEGKFDGVVEVGGKYWILEHKTAKTLKADHTLRDQQINVYVLAARKLDLPVEGVIYNIVRKAVPEKPKVLKNGKLSKSLSQNITYDSYMAAIQELGQDPEYYQDVLDQLKNMKNPFIHREFVPRTLENSREALKDIQQAEALKYAMIQNGIFPRNITKDCSWDCPFADLCLAELEGHDTTKLFQDRYTVVQSK